jgi:prepilin-type N-terminal cleavage/methylation domain-containing protein/prepilin-type processing-associated H-X9-DG protein
MRGKKAFTLIELLVVIAIIALLLSIIMPALKKVKQAGQRIVCLSLIRSYSSSNIAYAAQYDGKFVPFSQESLSGHEGDFGYWDERWPENMEYREFLTLDSRKVIRDNGWEDPYIFPKELMCPGQDVDFTKAFLMDVESELGWEMRMSFAMNTEKWAGSSTDDLLSWYPSDRIYRGHISYQIKSPSSRMVFIDSNHYQTRYDRANFLEYWDVYGDTILATNWAQVAYRHNEGAALAFFDGHSEFLKKEDVYNVNNPVPQYNPTDRLSEPLWDVE